MKKRFLAIITARGGSKGIPGKNIKLLGGKPLIAYTIEAAKHARSIDRLILSTDDEAIAAVAREYGCEVPFMRSKELAEDTTPHPPVLHHAVKWLKEEEGYEADYVVTLQPTSPFRTATHIDEAATLIEDAGADSLIAVSKTPSRFSHFKAFIRDAEGFVTLVNGDPIYKRPARRQDLPEAFFSNGMLYIVRNAIIVQDGSRMYGEKTVPYVIDARYAVDIDALEDWEVAEKMVYKV
jgi:CMP-N-acetylneuraminic acid synthetase